MKQKLIFLAIGFLLGMAIPAFLGVGMVGRYEGIMDGAYILDTVTGKAFETGDRVDYGW